MIYDLMRILKYSIVLLSHPLFETHFILRVSISFCYNFEKNLESFDPQLLSSCFQFDF